MSNKKGKNQNPLLAAFEAKLRKEFAEELKEYDRLKEAEFDERLARNTEIERIAMLMSGNEFGIIGQKRSGLLLEEQIDTKIQIAKAIMEDDNPDLIKVKHDIAKRLKATMGRENWEKHCHLFPLLREYWPWE